MSSRRSGSDLLVAIALLCCVSGCFDDLRGPRCDSERDCFENETCKEGLCHPVESQQNAEAPVTEITGTVTDADTVPPKGIETVYLCTLPLGTNISTTSQDGSYTFPLDNAEPITLHVGKEGYAIQTYDIDPKEHENDLDISLVPCNLCNDCECGNPCDPAMQ